MTKLLSMIVAAMFAVVSVNAIGAAHAPAGDKKGDAKKEMKKGEGKKEEGKKKDDKKKDDKKKDDKKK